MMRRTTAAWVLVLALTACGRSHAPGAHGNDLGSDADPSCDEGPPGEDPLDPDQAACIGLIEPVCASCHLREGTFYLRPFGTPPPPEHVVPVMPPGDCLEIPEPPPPLPLDPDAEVVLTDDEAACLGIDRPVCVSCHRRHDVLVLRPIGVPPPPPDADIPPLETCL